MGILGRLFALDMTGEESSKKGLYSKLFHANRIGFIKKISKDMEKEIADLALHIQDFNRKVSLLKRFADTREDNDLEKLTAAIKELKNIVSAEKKLDSKENTIVLKVQNSIRKVLANEQDHGFLNDEAEMRQELTELQIDIEELQPIIESQLKFLELPAKEQRTRIKELYTDIRREAKILGCEQKYLKELKESIEKYEVDAVVND